MQKQQVKLIKSENGGEQYHIIINKVVGKGGFGIVNEARCLSNPKQRLVVKTIKIQNQQKRQVIQNELKIMSELPYQQNLVKVIPVKMYSANNYYIFMEYCDGGSLYDQYLRKKNHLFQQQELYDIFYQCMNGYKALFDRKIMHQDIKPQNILIRKNLYKLADFGLSLFYEGHDFGDSREGTMSYIAPQKLTIRNYVGNPKADIYSFGVMFYQLITGYHPYVKINRRGNHHQFMKQLLNNKLRYPENLNIRYSLKFQTFFDIIVRMIKRAQKDRISFEQIESYVKDNDVFDKSREKQKQLSKKYLIEEYDFVISEITSILTLPVNVPKEEEEKMRKNFEEKMKEQSPKAIQLGKQVGNYFIKRRLIVYYLDRLARKLIVEQLKQKNNNQAYSRTIFYLMILCKSLLNDLVRELKTPKQLDSESFCAFKRTNPMALDITNLLRKDHEYVQDSLCELLAQCKSIPKKQLKIIFQMLRHNSQEALVANLMISLNSILRLRTGLIEINNKNHLLTLVNIFTILQILQDVPKAILMAEELENIDKKAITSSPPELIAIIQNKSAQKQISCSFDMTGMYEQEHEEDMEFEPII